MALNWNIATVNNSDGSGYLVLSVKTCMAVILNCKCKKQRWFMISGVEQTLRSTTVMRKVPRAQDFWCWEDIGIATNMTMVLHAQSITVFLIHWQRFYVQNQSRVSNFTTCLTSGPASVSLASYGKVNECVIAGTSPSLFFAGLPNGKPGQRNLGHDDVNGNSKFKC